MTKNVFEYTLTLSGKFGRNRTDKATTLPMLDSDHELRNGRDAELATTFAVTLSRANAKYGCIARIVERHAKVEVGPAGNELYRTYDSHCVVIYAYRVGDGEIAVDKSGAAR